MSRIILAAAFLAVLPIAAYAQAIVAAPAPSWWQTALSVYVLPAVGIWVAGIITWASTWFTAKTHIDIEAKWRESLHSAIMSGLLWGIEQLGGIGNIKTEADKNQVIKSAEAWTHKSVPDAVTGLKLDGALGASKIVTLAIGKLQGLLDDVIVMPVLPVIKPVRHK